MKTKNRIYVNRYDSNRDDLTQANRNVKPSAFNPGPGETNRKIAMKQIQRLRNKVRNKRESAWQKR